MVEGPAVQWYVQDVFDRHNLISEDRLLRKGSCFPTNPIAAATVRLITHQYLKRNDITMTAKFHISALYVHPASRITSGAR